MPPKPQLGSLWKCSICGALVRCKAPTGNALDAWVPTRHRVAGVPCEGHLYDAVEYKPEVPSE